MNKRESGLYVANSFDFLVRKFKASERVVTLPNGQKVRVSIDDSRTVAQIEEDERLHAVVRPRTQTIKIRRPL